jgi:hypothetical protein
MIFSLVNYVKYVAKIGCPTPRLPERLARCNQVALIGDVASEDIFPIAVPSCLPSPACARASRPRLAIALGAHYTPVKSKWIWILGSPIRFLDRRFASGSCDPLALKVFVSECKATAAADPCLHRIRVPNQDSHMQIALCGWKVHFLPSPAQHMFP